MAWAVGDPKGVPALDPALIAGATEPVSRLGSSSVDPGEVRHKAKMKRKAERNATLAPGFKAMPNRRIDGAIAAATMVLIAQGVLPIDAEASARRQVASTLPARRMVHNTEPSRGKNSDPAYRKSIWPAATCERRAAQVDTLPKGRDAKQGSVRSKGSAVAESHAPNPSPSGKAVEL